MFSLRLHAPSFKLVPIAVICILIAIQSFSSAADLDAPHDASFGAGCQSCHDMTAFDQPRLIPRNGHVPQDIDDWLYNNICLGCHDGVTATEGHFHSSRTTSAKYGTWTVGCSVCHNQHTQEQDHDFSTSYGKFIRRNIDLSQILDNAPPNGSTVAGKSGIRKVTFIASAGPSSYADGDENIDGICEVCHTRTSHFRNDGSFSGVGVHAGLKGSYCMRCHSPDIGLEPDYQCLDCHDDAANPETNAGRVAVNQQFGANSHHVQRGDGSIVNADCHKCHWEADINGKVTTYHGATPGSAVDLVIYGSNTRPADGSYNIGSTAIAYAADGSRAQIESINSHCLGCHDDDSKGEDIFGDGKSPDFYAWDGNSVDSKYSDTGTTAWGKYPVSSRKDLVTKAFSAHGNAPANTGGNAITKYGVFVESESWPNTRGGSVKVACFDCHNSHGSTVSGITTSYTSATANGGLLKNTLTGKGGYSTDYSPVSGGREAARNQFNAGADLCFDCHLSANGSQTPWGYTTYGATEPVRGFSDYDRFGADSDVRHTHAGGHFGASQPLSVPATKPINGLCTSCHDPHGVSPSIAQDYGVPLLKGTWLSSPYSLDRPKESAGKGAGGSMGGTWTNPPRYKIDQNTFTSWDFTSTAGITESVSDFGGLCLQCHPQASIDPDATSAWKTMDRVHETVKGWGANSKHSFPCAKCHTPHATERLPRLMISNCLNSKHKGRQKNNLTPALIMSDSTDTAGPSNSDHRSGNGRYAAGGMGSNGKIGFGLGVSCHDSIGTGGYPDSNLWNNVTPWLDKDNDETYYYTSNPTSPIGDCDDNDASVYRALDQTCDGDNDGLIDATAGGSDCDDNDNTTGYVPAVCDKDGDNLIDEAAGGYDCDDNDIAIGMADDGICDSDNDGGIDWTAGGTDCADQNPDYNLMAIDGTCDGDGDGLIDLSAGGTDCNDNDQLVKNAPDGTCDGDGDGIIDTGARPNTDAGLDCDDNDPAIGSASDNNCNNDNDAFIDQTAGGTDCNDSNAAIGAAPDGTCDGDGDGRIDAAANPVSDSGLDCDDNDPVVRNPTDGNCDNDGDGYIDATAFGSDCYDFNPSITEAADGTCDGDSDSLYDLTAGGTDCDDADAGIAAAPDSTCDGDSDGHIDWQAGGDDCQDDNVGYFAVDGTCDGDGDSLVDMTAGGTDCDDSDSNIKAAADATCDGDSDTFIDPSAGGTDCDDNNAGIGYVPATCDVDGDTFVSLSYGGVDCLDTDAAVTWAVDGTCDGDGDTFIDWTAGANDCDDSNGAVIPSCDIIGTSSAYTTNTMTDNTADWPLNIFTGRTVTYHVTQLSCVWFPSFSCTTTEHYSTRTITGNTGNRLTVDSNWDFTTGYTPRDYAITLN